jgi:2-dehydro-3-deoxyphosphogluconate aldolase / (4S)-4-hydroxy-2-oxoglutarate aldolase
MNVRDIVIVGAVIPELNASDTAAAVHLARALCAGGLRVLEFSVREPGAAACIEAVRKAAPDAIVGAGALTRAVDFAGADRAGAQFGSSPGLIPELAAASRGARFPLLPGVMSPAEIITARNAGFTVLKFFPAEQAGGVAALQAYGALFPDILFCASGGVTRLNAQNYLALPNVACIAASWMVPPGLQSAGDWREIEALARDAASLR